MKYQSKLTPDDAIKWLTSAVTENCETTCDQCKSFQYCDYGRSLKMATDALNVRFLCKYANIDDVCKHTSNIRYAKNFTEVAPGRFMENGGDSDGSEESN